jgi:CheY-like chemotaxis protein
MLGPNHYGLVYASDGRLRRFRLLREVPGLPQVPIIACTAHDTSTHRIQALDVSFNEFLAKPIDFNQLMSGLLS